MNRRRKRTLLMVLLLLLAYVAGGAIINVAVAWGCAAAFDPCIAPMSICQEMSISQEFEDNSCVKTAANQLSFGHRRINQFLVS